MRFPQGIKDSEIGGGGASCNRENVEKGGRISERCVQIKFSLEMTIDDLSTNYPLPVDMLWTTGDVVILIKGGRGVLVVVHFVDKERSSQSAMRQEYSYDKLYV